MLAMSIVGVIAGSAAWGFHSFTSLSGTHVSAGRGLGLLFASIAVYALPLAAIAAVGLLLSTVTRNSAASVVGTLMFALFMQLIGVLPGTESFRPYLLGTQFDARRVDAGRHARNRNPPHARRHQDISYEIVAYKAGQFAAFTVK
jgi:ABC-2 type transport system permease protein